MRSTAKKKTHSPIYPNLLDTTWQMIEQLGQRILRKVFGWNAGNEKGISLNRCSVSWFDQVPLAGGHEMAHLVLDVVEYPS
jgi:hypothetical protein